MIHPSTQPGFHPTTLTWVFLAAFIILAVAFTRKKGSS